MTEEHRRFYWSAQTLRCDIFDADCLIDRTEDVLGIDHQRCIIAYEPYADIIVGLLNQHFSGDTVAGDIKPEEVK